MGRSSNSVSAGPRRESARRRRVLLAEPLESRQLLSAAAFQPMVATGLNVSAILGPAQTATITPIVPGAPTVSMASEIEIGFGLNPIVPNAPAGSGAGQTILVIEISFSGGPGASAGGGASSPAPTSGMGEMAGTSGTSGTSSSSGATSTTSSITALTPTGLAGPTARAQTAAVVFVAPPQPLVVNLAPSTISAATQAILQQAILEEQPVGPPVLGQGFESPVGQGLEWNPAANPGALLPRIRQALPPATDIIQPLRPPAQDAPQPLEPGETVEPPALPAPAPEKAPVDNEPLEPLRTTDLEQAQRIPDVAPRLDTETRGDPPSWSMASMVGTAAIVSGGYRLALGGSNRFNQRWIPTRRSSRSTRGRR